MELFDIITKPIEAEFAAFRKMQDDLAVNPNPLLREIILHVNKQRGKQMRPMMVMLFGKMFGEVSETTYSAALALELLHTASLVHDDVVDDSMQRRGQASVNAIYNNKLAVLVGDYLLSTALVFTGRCGDPRITNIVGALGQTLADGEIFQMFHSHEKMVSEEVYFEIIRKKTASLFSSCAEIGALSAGAQSDDVARARQIGEYIGICFQIRDDIFDYYSNDVGKPTGNDMREGKLTLPIIYAVRTEGDDRIREMITRQQQKYGWEFLFLGANIDAVETAKHFGIGSDRAVRFHNDRKGVALNYETVSRTVGSMRMSQPIEEDWKADIEADFASRDADR